MKIIIFILLVLMSLSVSAQWEIINEGFRGQINTIDFVNENVGWMGGWNGTLLKTTDGGGTWNNIQINENWNIGQIDFINDMIGWATGRIGWDSVAVWKTYDGGTNWIQQLSNIGFLSLLGFSSIYVLDEYNAYVVGSDTIFKTTNGGTNWVDISPNLPERNYNSVWFQDSQKGVVVGNYYDGIADRGIILRTTDGGINWDETIVNDFNSITDLQFLDSLSGYFRANLDTMDYICKTEDMFASWTIITQRPYPITSYQYLDNNTVYATIGDSITENNIMRSLDGGFSWQNIQSFNVDMLKFYKIIFKTSNDGFIIGGSITFRGTRGCNFLIRSINGQIFEIKRFSLDYAVWPLTSVDIDFFDSNKLFIGVNFHGHASCYTGRIFSTTDGGESWNIGNGLLVEEQFKSFFFLNDIIGYYLTTSKIYNTTNSGASWTECSGYTGIFSGNDISFINQQEGWIVGTSDDQPNNYLSRGRIISTTNAGEIWNVEWTDSIDWSRLNAICFRSQTGWAVGDKGSIVKYIPQSGWEKQNSVTTLPLNKVFFSDENNGWIAGGFHNIWTDNSFQSILLKTTNGGVNWNTVSNIPYLFRDIAFIDNNLGWAIGYNSSSVGGILKSTDGGLTWEINTGNLPAQLNAFHIKNGYGWAVGDNGLILRNTDAGITWVENQNQTVPTEFVLEQNYPNPFNPSTSINYQLPKSSKVILKIYDVLGREIATLVNEEKPTGIYEVEFNSKNLSSGVYFYKLKANEYVATKKMVLLK